MRESSMHHEKNLNCPMCRAILVQYYSAETLNIENDENQRYSSKPGSNPGSNLGSKPNSNPNSKH